MKSPRPPKPPTVFEQIAAVGRQNAQELEQSFQGPRIDVATDYLRLNPNNPRRRISPVSVQRMATAIRQAGRILQPLLVRPIALDAAGARYEVVCGNRRLLGAREAGLYHVPVRVEEITDADAVKYAAWENLAREDLDPIDQAEAVDALRTLEHLTWEELGGRFGMTRQWAWRQQRLTVLPEPVKDLVRDGRLSVSNAYALGTLAVEEESVALAQEIAETGMSARAVSRRIAEEGGKGVTTLLQRPWSPPPGYTGRAYGRLHRAVEDLLEYGQSGKIPPDLADALRPVLGRALGDDQSTQTTEGPG